MLILRKIIKTVANRCQILRLKCTKFDYGGASPHGPVGELIALLHRWGAYSAPPDSLAAMPYF